LYTWLTHVGAEFNGDAALQEVGELVDRSPEKAGVGGSIPSLATIKSTTYKPSKPQFRSISFQLSRPVQKSL